MTVGVLGVLGVVWGVLGGSALNSMLITRAEVGAPAQATERLRLRLVAAAEALEPAVSSHAPRYRHRLARHCARTASVLRHLRSALLAVVPALRANLLDSRASAHSSGSRMCRASPVCILAAVGVSPSRVAGRRLGWGGGT